MSSASQTVGQARGPPRRGRWPRRRSGRRRCSAAGRRPGPRRTGPSGRAARPARSSLSASASGRAKTVPALARMTFGLVRSVRGDAAMTGAGPGAVGAAQDGADVARLLDAFDDDDEGIGRDRQVREGPRRRPDDGDEAFRPVPEGELGERDLGRAMDAGRRRPRRRRARPARPGHPLRRAAARTRTPPRPRRRRQGLGAARGRRRRWSDPVVARSRRSRRAAAARIRGLAALASTDAGCGLPVTIVGPGTPRRPSSRRAPLVARSSTAPPVGAPPGGSPREAVRALPSRAGE